MEALKVKHTQGLVIVEVEQIAEDFKDMVAIRWREGKIIRRVKYPAALIASAPDLLDLARTMMDYLTDDYVGSTEDMIEAVGAIISKAEGR